MLIPVFNSIVHQRIDRRFDQNTIILITNVGKMLKLDVNKCDIELSYFDISEDEFKTKIRFHLSRNKDRMT